MRNEQTMRDILVGGLETVSLKGTRLQMRILVGIAKGVGRGLLATALVLLWLAGGRGMAQQQNAGTVSGNVVDAQGAVIPNAVVTLIETSEGSEVTTKSNAHGEYLFPVVAIGNYQLKVSAPTFETYIVNDVQVDAASNVRQDAHMHAGAVEAQVTVQAEGTTLDTRSATLGTMIDPQMVEGLPVDGENIVSMAALLPGVTNVNAPTTFTSDTGGPTYSVSGSRGNQNLFLFDGLIWNNTFYNTGLNYPPHLALEEVSVLLNNYKAQYGRNSGSVFNVLSKRGTNALHGDLWEYYQNAALNAADYLTHVNPHLVSDQFGINIGGPIKRDKLFFFLSYQDLRLAGQLVAKDETPSYAELGFDAPGTPHLCAAGSPFAGQQCGNYTADFCYVYNPVSCPSPVTPSTAVTNPVYKNSSLAASTFNAAWLQSGHTGTSPCLTALQSYESTPGFTSSQQEHLPTPELPLFCFNPVTSAFANKYLPVATQQVAGSQLLQAISRNPQPRNDQEGLARVDWSLGRHTIDARFYVTNQNDVTSNSVSQGQGVANYEPDLNVAGIYAGMIHDAWVLTPNVLNSLRVGYKRYTYIILPTDKTTISDLGANYSQPGHPFLPKMEATDRFTIGGSSSGNSATVNQNEELDDDLNWTHGNHNFQFGATFLRLDYLHRFDQVPFFESEQQNTEVTVADFLLGLQYQEVVGNSTNLASRQYALYMYAQDDWRATSRLTLNLGFRYELPFSWREVDGEGVTFQPGYQSKVFPQALADVAFQGDPGIGNTSPPTKYNLLGPRFGFAYDTRGTGVTVLRGGFGIFYDALSANLVGVSEPYHYTANYALPAGGYSVPLLGEACIPPNYVKGQTGATGPTQPNQCLSNSSYFAYPYTINYADRHLTTPYTMAINVGIQQRISRSATMEVNYVGKLGRHGMIPIDQNPSIFDCSGSYFLANPSVYCYNAASNQASYEARSRYPGFNYGGQGVVDNESIGSSSYNGLQVVYKQKAGRNINIYSSYAYARSIDISSNGLTNTANVPQPNHLNLEYAASDFNAQQILNVGWIVKMPTAHVTSGFMKAIANDWYYGGIYNARTGFPINITIAGDQSLTDERTQRPSLTPGYSPTLPSNRHRTDKVNHWFNNYGCPTPTSVPVGAPTPTPCAFTVPTTGTFGTLRRNALVGPAFINTQMDIQKFFTVREGKTLEFRVDAFNVFNTPNLAPPNTSLASAASDVTASNFGQILSTVGTNGAVGTNGRRIQLALIYRF